jgi:hypothetical protein
MTLYIKSKLSDLLVEAAKERSLADTLYLAGVLAESSKENFQSILDDATARLMCEDPVAANWLLVEVLASNLSDEEKAAIAERMNEGQVSLYRMRGNQEG